MHYKVISQVVRVGLCLLTTLTLMAPHGPATRSSAAARASEASAVVAARHAPIGRAVPETRERPALRPGASQRMIQFKAQVKAGSGLYPKIGSTTPYHRTELNITAASTCTVTTPADSGPGSLRQCLAGAAPGGSIVFNPSAFPLQAPVTITLASSLPTIITHSLTIDASNAGVILNGNGLTGTGTGLVVDGASGVTIRGLRIVNFPVDGIELIGGASNNIVGGTAAGAGNVIGGNGEAGIWISGTGTDNNQVLGNYLGTDAAGMAALGNQWGVIVGYGAQGNVIGDTPAGARNVISGNDVGVQFQDNGTTGNQVLGNLIGTDPTGLAALGNYLGVYITRGADGNTVGGTAAGARNVISGSIADGVVVDGNGTSGNTVLGNYIGTDVMGEAALGNDTGVLISGAQNNVIGGASPGSRNVISGNYNDGIQIQDEGANSTTGNRVLGNDIGTDATGETALGNWDSGVVVAFGADNNVIGGTGAGEGNVISANVANGVVLQGSGTLDNQVLGNLIGTDATGTTALGNGWGVAITSGAQNNHIGGEAAGARNVIGGNMDRGVALEGAGTTGNSVLGNYIGTDVTGSSPLSNLIGVVIFLGAQGNVVGGTAAGARNVVSGNADVGVVFQDNGTSNNQLLGNYIGTTVTGTTALGNGWGVVIFEGADNNIVGGATAGARNVISGNAGPGVQIQGDGTANNEVAGNYLGTDVTGAAALGNKHGVIILLGADDNIVGGTTAGARNVISGNAEAGVAIERLGTTGNTVLGNYIGTDATGAAAVGNQWGVLIGFGAQNNSVGDAVAGAGNVISGNTDTGVLIQDDGTNGIQVRGNRIGTDATGMARLGNRWGVLVLWGADGNLIGGMASAARNVISGNEYGVQFQDNGTTNNQTLGNYIGTDAMGTQPISNTLGVVIGFGADNNVVGGTAVGAANVVSGNDGAGVLIADNGTTGNQVLGNSIGTTVTGTQPLSNTVYGVYLLSGASSNTIGVSNTIAYNGLVGVAISGTTTLQNTITRNAIYGNGGRPIDYLDAPDPLAPPPFCYTALNAADVQVSGSLCPSCRAEFFRNPTVALAGTTFLTTVTADAGGNFAPLTLPISAAARYASATVTDASGTTSEVYAVPECASGGMFFLYLPLMRK